MSVCVCIWVFACMRACVCVCSHVSVCVCVCVCEREREIEIEREFPFLILLQALVKHCKTLRHLSLLGGSRITDRCIRHVARENRKLRTIKIEGEAL